MAQQASGLALRSLERPRESAAALRQSVRTALAAGLAGQAGRARMSLAVSLVYLGRRRQALQALDRAAAELTGVELAELEVQRAIVLWLLGRPAAAAEGVPAALARLRSAGERLWVARGLNILGLTSVELGRFEQADDAFRQAAEAFAELGQFADAAGNQHDRGWCAALLGDIPAALRHYEEAERRFATLDLPLVELRLDRARLLLGAGLARDALVTSSQVADELAARGESSAHADALLVVAEAALATGDLDVARRSAERSRALCRRQGRVGRAALAGHLTVRARWADGERGPALYRATRTVAVQLRREGLADPADQALLLAGRLARETGASRAADEALVQVARGRWRGSAYGRSQAWFAEALVRLDRGDRRGALAALRAGFRVLDTHGAGLGSLELRAHVAEQAAELVVAGRRIAVESGRAEQVLRWSELGRGLALRLPPVRPPEDPELAVALAELRRLSTQPSGGWRLRREAELRDLVRRRVHRIEGPSRSQPWALPARTDIDLALCGAALVSLVVVDGFLHASVIADGRMSLHRLGPVAPIIWEARFLGMWLRRALLPDRPESTLARAFTEAQEAAGRVDAALFRPLARTVGDRDLVVIPPASLAMLPWQLLTTAAGRTLSTAPSLICWYDATRRRPLDGPAALVAGPGLDHAEGEVRELAGFYPDAVVLTGDDARSDAALAAMSGARVAHVAAHGDVHPESPLFSAVRLADGPLMAYDLERMAPPPDLVVLSACDSASGDGPGEELLGLAVAVLRGGARSVIASVARVPDHATLDVMTVMHRQIAAGTAPHRALAGTVATLRAEGAPPLTRAASVAFLAVGSTGPDTGVPPAEAGWPCP
ncbi:MAG TPA: CHAT domain-containing tetratricopeptide repeat protein [Mycobacteriales bacterium]